MDEDLNEPSGFTDPTEPTAPDVDPAEQALVNANRELMQRFERKIAAALARVWGEAAG